MQYGSNQHIAQSWHNGFPMHSKNMSTDGRDLFSYGLRIGYTSGGHKIVIDYTKEGGMYKSMTTSHHVGIAKKYAIKVVKPKEIGRY